MSRLANYRSSDCSSEADLLKLPGPSGQLLKVEALRDDVEFLQSIRLPVKLTFIGNLKKCEGFRRIVVL